MGPDIGPFWLCHPRNTHPRFRGAVHFADGLLLVVLLGKASILFQNWAW